MKKSSIFILTIISTLILLDSYIPSIDNSINNESNVNINNTFYLDHNITVNQNQTLSFNNENIEVFTKNISIMDYGTLNITDSELCAINYTITFNVYGG